MRIVRFSDGESPRYDAFKEGSSCIVVLEGNPPFSEIEPDGRIIELEEVHPLSPAIPRLKVIGTGTNFDEKIRVPGLSGPETMPSIFIKTSTLVIGPDGPIILPKWSQGVIYEGELIIVIKSLAKDMPLDEVDQAILGYILCNDVIARDAMDDGLWLKGKSFDTTCPLGPWIVVNPELDVQNLVISGNVGDAHTTGLAAYMLYTVCEFVAYCSTFFTPLSGDVVTTDRPGVSGSIEAGDTVSFEIPEIDRFTNPVTRR